jgi:hypothetical protein
MVYFLFRNYTSKDVYILKIPYIDCTNSFYIECLLKSISSQNINLLRVTLNNGTSEDLLDEKIFIAVVNTKMKMWLIYLNLIFYDMDYIQLKLMLDSHGIHM